MLVSHTGPRFRAGFFFREENIRAFWQEKKTKKVEEGSFFSVDEFVCPPLSPFSSLALLITPGVKKELLLGLEEKSWRQKRREERDKSEKPDTEAEKEEKRLQRRTRAERGDSCRRGARRSWWRPSLRRTTRLRFCRYSFSSLFRRRGTFSVFHFSSTSLLLLIRFLLASKLNLAPTLKAKRLLCPP